MFTHILQVMVDMFSAYNGTECWPSDDCDLLT